MVRDKSNDSRRFTLSFRNYKTKQLTNNILKTTSRIILGNIIKQIN